MQTSERTDAASTTVAGGSEQRPFGVKRVFWVPELGMATVLIPLFLAGCHRGSGLSGSAAPAPSATLEGRTPIAMAAACGVPATTTISLANTPIVEPLATFDTAWSIIARTHWDTTYNGVDWTAVRTRLRPRAAAAVTTGELRGVMTEMLGTLKQSHFSIIPRETSDGSGGSNGSAMPSEAGTVSKDPNGSTGLVLRYLEQRLVVTRVPTGSAADRAGVQPGWIMESVKGCGVAGRLARATAEPDPRRAALTAFSVGSQMLAGPVGDSVEATFLDGDDRPRRVTMVRQREAGTSAKFGNLPAMPASLTVERVVHQGKRIGIIAFNIWMPVLSPQFDAAMDTLRDSDAIVVDVRGNFGGVGGMSMGIAGHFLDSAYTIGTMHQRGATLKFVANPRRVNTRAEPVNPFSGPLALLVDELSVSTTEIFAGGMQALGRARVFGSQTAGQALPSVPERLPNGDILYHAIADFLSPTGKPLEGDGVTPDVRTPITRKALLRGRDPTREAALDWAVRATSTR